MSLSGEEQKAVMSLSGEELKTQRQTVFVTPIHDSTASDCSV